MTGQVLVAFVLVATAVGAGLSAAGWLRSVLRVPTLTALSLALAIGLIYVGVTTLLLGHLGLLAWWLPFAQLALAGVLLAASWRKSADLVRDVLRGVTRQLRTHPLLVGVVLLGLVMAAVATLAPPTLTDEVQYHWPAPLAWAESGQWNASPYRHVNGFAFMEIIYTAAATQQSYVAAHALHLLTLPALGAAAGGIAQSLGLRGRAQVVAGALAMSVVWNSSYAAYNDLPVGALATAAVAVVLAQPESRRHVWVSAGLLAAAISVKPTAAAAVGLVGLLLFAHSSGSWRARLRWRGPLLRSWAILAGVAAVTIAFWTLRRHAFTGQWSDPDMVIGVNPELAEAHQLPSAAEQLLAPIMPLFTGVVGAQEPWGGRTSLLVQIFLIPAIVYVLWARGRVLRSFANVTIPAWLHWFILGFVGVRTRFHIVVWVLSVVAIRIAVEDAAQRWPQAAPWLERAWTGLVLLGMADVGFEMIRAIQLI